jgi:hypothetical protein
MLSRRRTILRAMQSPLVKKKSPTSASRPSTYSTRKALKPPGTAYSWPVVAVVAAVAAAAVVAAAAAAAAVVSEGAEAAAAAVAAVFPGVVAVYAEHGDARTYLKTQVVMAGFDKFDPANPCLVATRPSHARDRDCKYWPNGFAAFSKCQCELHGVRTSAVGEYGRRGDREC